MTGHPFAAQILRASDDGFAGIAASRLFETDPSLAERHGPGAFESWRLHMKNQLTELAAAVADGLPEAFATRVAWSQAAFSARDVPVGDLAAGLESLRAVLQEELPAAAWSALGDYFESAAARLQAGSKASATALDASKPTGKLALDFVTQLLSGEAQKARALVLEALAKDLDVQDALLQVLVPAMHEVGRLWHQNQISVAEEHFATRVTRRLISRIVEDAPTAARTGKTVVVAAAPGDAHDIAPDLISDLFHLAGWRAIGLGADVPALDIALAAERFKADLVALSATLDIQRDALAEAIRALRAGPRPVPVLVGGSAFAANDQLWKTVGADGYVAHAAEATQRGLELLGG